METILARRAADGSTDRKAPLILDRAVQRETARPRSAPRSVERLEREGVGMAIVLLV